MLPLVIQQLGLRKYTPVWESMRTFTRQRHADSADEFWLVEHPPVYTLGLNGDPTHVLDAGDIPVIKVDRGGQVTYHGPGQVIIYLLIDLRRLGLGVRGLVTNMEQALIGFLSHYGVHAEADPHAPGVYVAGRKIASLGLRVSRGCSYHGIAFNLNMDLSPFKHINPCGFPGLPVTRLTDLGIKLDWDYAANQLVTYLQQQLGYTNPIKIVDQRK
ncbi:MAG: lipoyl(octanoyl) transferase LipB [Pseudomonadota bacterium]